MKHTLIILLGLLVVGGLAWLIRPEYGSSYSEEQRRLWNERKELYPAAWGMTEMFSIDVDSFYMTLTGMEKNAAMRQLEKNREKDRQIISELERNRDRAEPDFAVKAPASIRVHHLPLDGLTRRETAERALAGDGDACLKMVQYLCPRRGGEGVAGLTWREKYESCKWLDLAISLRRPGAGFIKNFLKEVWNVQTSSISSERKVKQVDGPEMSTVEGYAEFVENLKMGDFLLYQTAVQICYCDVLSEEYRLISNVALARVGGNEAGALEEMAKLYFTISPKYYGLYYAIEAAAWEKKENGERLLKWMPDSWRSRVMSGLVACGVMNVERTPVMNEYRQACHYSREAARKGSLTGMYLWLIYGIPNMKRYSAEDWNDILNYSRILLESGYAPYVERMQRTRIQMMEYKEWNEQILRLFYSGKSYGEFWERDYMTSRGGKDKRYYSYFVGEEIIKRNDLGETRKIVNELVVTGETDELLRILLVDKEDDRLFLRCCPEVQAFLLERMEKWAEEGDPHAMYVLAGIYGEGLSVPADPGRAYALLKRALPEAGKYLRMTILMKNEKDRPVWKRIYLDTAIRLRMADMVLSYPDFPGRNATEAYEEALRASQAPVNIPEYDYPTEVYRILGQFHEQGVGMQADRKKALEYYELGAPENKFCRKREERLSYSREGEKETADTLAK